MEEWDGKDDRRKKQCADHLNCVYRIELLEKWKEVIDKQMNGFQKLLIANLSGIITLLVSCLIGAIVIIAKTH
jgi:hypothetical protein